MCFDQWEGSRQFPMDLEAMRKFFGPFGLCPDKRSGTLWIVSVAVDVDNGQGGTWYDNYTRFAWNEADFRECVAEFAREFPGVEPSIRKFTGVTVKSMRIGNGADRDTTGG